MYHNFNNAFANFLDYNHRDRRSGRESLYHYPADKIPDALRLIAQAKSALFDLSQSYTQVLARWAVSPTNVIIKPKNMWVLRFEDKRGLRTPIQHHFSGDEETITRLTDASYDDWSNMRIDGMGYMSQCFIQSKYGPLVKKSWENVSVPFYIDERHTFSKAPILGINLQNISLSRIRNLVFDRMGSMGRINELKRRLESRLISGASLNTEDHDLMLCLPTIIEFCMGKSSKRLHETVLTSA